MKKFALVLSFFLLIAATLLSATAITKDLQRKQGGKFVHSSFPVADTTLTPEALHLITVVINASSTFNIEAVANLYTPNAVIADDEPPYSWSGPTAGVQWVNAIEKACKDFKVTRFKAFINPIKVVQQTDEVVYVIVPVEYKGSMPGGRSFEAVGAFTFVLRWVGDKWLVKTQAWMPKKGM